jgi:hypothetical protein
MSSTTTTVATTTVPATTIAVDLAESGDAPSIALNFVKLAATGRGLEPVAADYRFINPEGGTEPAPDTAARLFADAAPLRGLPNITSIEVAPNANGDPLSGCYFAGDIHHACDIKIIRGSSPPLTVSVFMIPDRRDPQHARYVVDGFFFPPIQTAIVFVERAIRGASVEDLVATTTFGDDLHVKTPIPIRPSELNAKAKLLATTAPATVIARAAPRTVGPFDCRAVIGQAVVACTIDVARDASMSTVVATLVGINGPMYKVSDFTTT